MAEKLLVVDNLSKDFYLHEAKKTVKSCRNISFSLETGEFLGIIGRSGAGKSTILKCIYRTYLPISGEIWYESASFGRIDLARASEREMLHLRRREIGNVTQFLNAMPRTSAVEHVVSALLEAGCDRGEARSRAEEVLRFFRLPENLWELFPTTFSGGERLRLNLARATAKQPRLLLLDEPTASLDKETKLLVRDMLKSLKRRRTSMIGVFHDIEFMEGICDRVISVSDGEVSE